MIRGVDRRTDKNMARRVVEEPRGSILPYLIVAAIAAVVVWSLLPSIPDPSVLFRKITPVEKVEPGPHPARGDVRTLFSVDDYPIDALRNGQQGTVQAQLSIGPSGRVADCVIIRSSGVSSLDEATCGIMKRRARFRPARDANGNAVPYSVVTPPVIWRLEG
jgi:protein TonB